MIEPAIEFIEKLIDQFSWRRLIISASILLAIATCVVVYESYTGAFRLQKIERVVALAERLNNLREPIDPRVRRNINTILVNATGELVAFTSSNATALSLDKRLLKGMAAFGPWMFFLVLFPLVSSEGTKEAIAGVLLLAIPLAVVGAILPDSRFQWVNYVLYPVGSFIAAVFLVVAWHRRKRSRATYS